MTLIALVGADGAGKTTIAEMLQREAPWPVKYLYMGTAVAGSNVALPTSRLIHYLKARAERRAQRLTAAGGAASVAVVEATTGVVLQQPPGQQSVRRGRVGVFLRVVNRLAEEWFRQLVAWRHERQGYVVICDRHFLFEYAPWRVKAARQSLPLAERFHMWVLSRFYPEPDLVIFLDAPPDVLQQRKPEWPLERLHRHREAYQTIGRQTRRFRRVDATRPLPEVYSAVVSHLEELLDT